MWSMARLRSSGIAAVLRSPSTAHYFISIGSVHYPARVIEMSATDLQ
jgi:hypothetical protein